jgi:hypothetical protein
MVLLLTAFLELPTCLSALSIYTDSYIERYKNKLINKTGEQSVVIEYPLIIFFRHLIGVILFLLFVSPLLDLEDEDGFVLLLIPASIYSNPDTLKKRIIKENKGKSGIYRWINKKSVKTYIGIPVDLPRRLR